MRKTRVCRRFTSLLAEFRHQNDDLKRGTVGDQVGESDGVG
ncbi:MAG: hypothetical protein RL300_286 [Pseudomonadota bacterium]